MEPVEAMERGGGRTAGPRITADVDEQPDELGRSARRRAVPSEAVRASPDEEAALDPASELGVGDAGLSGLRSGEDTQLTCRRHREATIRVGHAPSMTGGCAPTLHGADRVSGSARIDESTRCADTEH
jgi:hypothetical protein